MKEAIVNPDLSVEIKETPIPTAGEHQVVIKVIVSGLNPKDWKIPQV
jgi:NADPH2:quinone reductase